MALILSFVLIRSNLYARQHLMQTGEKLFTLVFDAESAFEEQDFSFSCKVIRETRFIAFGVDAVFSILGKNSIVKGVI